jgi:hypothetical protein
MYIDSSLITILETGVVVTTSLTAKSHNISNSFRHQKRVRIGTEEFNLYLQLNIPNSRCINGSFSLTSVTSGATSRKNLEDRVIDDASTTFIEWRKIILDNLKGVSTLSITVYP